jgi:hypothetical protein
VRALSEAAALNQHHEGAKQAISHGLLPATNGIFQTRYIAMDETPCWVRSWKAHRCAVGKRCNYVDGLMCHKRMRAMQRLAMHAHQRTNTGTAVVSATSISVRCAIAAFNAWHLTPQRWNNF